MWKSLANFSGRSRRRWLYGLMSLVFALSLQLGVPQASQGASWLDLLFRGIQIIQLSTISNTQEVRLGQQINQQLVRQRKISISRNSRLNAYVNQIGQRLVQTSTRANIPYSFQVVNDKSINAFATMGGFVYLNIGLIATAENEAELASVIAHEIGHVAARHAIQQMRQRAIAQGLLSATGLEREQAVQLGVQLALSLPNSREDELEADQLGLINLQKAGYAPIGMVSFMFKLLQKGGSAPSFLSTHPATSERITLLRRRLNPRTAQMGDGLDSQAYRARIRSIL